MCYQISIFMKHFFLPLAILLVTVSCTNTAIRSVSGVLEAKVGAATAPECVRQAMQNPVIDNRFEMILNDEQNHVAVWSLIHCSDDVSAEGYGVVVKNGPTTTVFPDVLHGKNPTAFYDSTTGNLWLATAVMEGTGTHVEQLHLLRFDSNGRATIANTIDPYDLQQTFIRHIGYSIDGKDITFYADKHPIHTATSTVDDMGGFYDEPVWIGEQISYVLGDTLRALVTPGVSFNVGKVLLYDDMPTFSADVILSDTAVAIQNIRVEKDDL